MPRSRPLLALLSLAFAAVCVRLGIWQLDRLAERRAANAAALARRALPEIALPRALPAESMAGRPCGRRADTSARARWCCAARSSAACRAWCW